MTSFLAQGECSSIEEMSIITKTSSTKEGLEDAVDAFRLLLGGEDNGGIDSAQPSGHRSINWDASIVPFDMPPCYFASRDFPSTVGKATRGVCVSTNLWRTGSDSQGFFAVSNPANTTVLVPPESIDDDKFDSINSAASQNLIQFSESRLFTSLTQNSMVVTFTEPVDEFTPALVSGFGAVFVDVDVYGETSISFYDKAGALLVEKDVPAKPNGLSFVGAYFGGEAIVDKVVLKLGEVAIDVGNESWGWGNSEKDVVVLDDFLYGEPVPLV